MSYKTILACLTTEMCAEEILPAACLLSARFEAHLVGIHTIEPVIPYPGIALHIDDPRFKAFNDAAAEADRAIESRFWAAIARYDVEGEWRSLRSRSATPSHDFVHSAYRSDIVVAAMPQRMGRTEYRPGIVEDLIVHSGRPVLLVPRDWRDRDVGSKPLLAWKETKEAAAAVHGALPFLQSTGKAHLVTIGPPQTEEQAATTDGHEVARFLSRHGAHVTVRHVVDEDVDAGRRILQTSAELECDLIVMGACGHSRLHGFLMRDATFAVLVSAQQPVLMAH